MIIPRHMTIFAASGRLEKLPAGPITLVSDVLGGGQMEHVVDVRAKATTVLWMD